ncbi:ankyrin repeat-containing domain protein [Amanita rubescens]|nr:ankyrin repeat-containing domain protein [Amanita rubescens]
MVVGPTSKRFRSQVYDSNLTSQTAYRVPVFCPLPLFVSRDPVRSYCILAIARDFILVIASALLSYQMVKVNEPWMSDVVADSLPSTHLDLLRPPSHVINMHANTIVNVRDSTLNEIHGNYVQTQYTYVNDEEILGKFKKWLNAPDPSTNHNIARKKHHKNTGQWILEDERYVIWKQQPNSLMWINGISGCGKTLICSTIIEDIKATLQMGPETGLVFFYFDINDKAKQSSRSLLSSLVLGLTAKSKNYLPLQMLYEKHCKLYSPTEGELLDLLMELLGGFKQAYIVLDALDECDEYHHLFEVINTIHNGQMSHFHFLVASRREQDIAVTMQECITAEIQLSAMLVSSDIISYIQSAVAEHRLRRWGSTVQEYIKEKLIHGSNGMFRWVACQIEELKKCPNQKVLLGTLESLPKDLEATYDQILQRIDRSMMSCAKVLLHWLILGMRPMKLEELAIVARFNPSEGGKYDLDLVLAHPDDVIYVCSSLVTKANDGTVELAHASVKEYFLAKPRVWREEIITLSGVEIGHNMIAHSCLTYLLQDGWHDSSWKSETFPLLLYSAQFWPDHYRLSNKDSTLKSLVIEFFCNGIFMAWTQINHSTRSLVRKYGKCLPIHCAAIFGLCDVMQNLTVDNMPSVEYSIAVEVASLNGYIAIVRFLLDKGADVNVQHGRYSSNALQSASSNGYTDIVKLLLDKGADVNAQGGFLYSNALEGASFNGYTEVVKLLLDNGADVNAEGSRGSLQSASLNQYTEIVNLLLDKGANVNAPSNGHTEIVKLLLDKGADVNAEGSRGSLQSASLKGHTEIVKLLLDKGADVNAQGRGPNALQSASSNGHTEIVKLLLDKGANVNAQGRGYPSALQSASSNGHTEIVKLLLDKGADVNAQGRGYPNALQSASSNGHTEIIKLLLDKGADVNAQDESDGNALEGASSHGHTKIVKLLLDKGADVNAQGSRGSLQSASFNGYTKIVKLLLDKGADVNAQGTMLAASVNGHTEIIKLLLSRGANVDAQGEEYGKAWRAASFYGHTEILKLFLDRVNVNAQVEEYEHLLQFESLRGHTEIVNLLLDKGIDPNAQGRDSEKYGNALQAAANCGHIEIVHLLLERGADVNVQGGFYGNALQAASFSSGNTEIVQLCLDNGADVNAQGGCYGSALQAAAAAVCDWRKNVDLQVVHLLLNHGADVNLKGGRYGSALNAARQNGYDHIVKILLEWGAIDE